MRRAGAPRRDAWRAAAQRLLAAQGATGLFPHHLPADMLGRFRSHVGCFADQAYAMQALARYGRETGDAACYRGGTVRGPARRLQGEGGQWWWHYDWRHGNVVERYPVYSVHQHSVAPMALLELAEAGGPDHRAAVAAGLGWLVERPESREQLIVDDWASCGARSAATSRARWSASSGRRCRRPTPRDEPHGWTGCSRRGPSTGSAVPSNWAGSSTPGGPAAWASPRRPCTCRPAAGVRSGGAGERP